MSALDDLVGLLDLEVLEVNLFRGESLDPDRVRLYGGEVLAQALMAAGRTVDGERRVHSMHAYFLKLGDPKVPVVYEVDRIRDGRSFTTRRVVAIQHGTAIFNMAASFQVDEIGPDHHDDAPDVPEAETLSSIWRPDPEDELEPIDRRGSPHVVDAFDMRHVGVFTPPGGVRGDEVQSPDMDTWFRTRGALPDDPLLHTCIVAVRVRSHAARHRAAAAPDDRRAPRLHGREPRPRDVVPPAVPRRRLVAVPHAQPVGRGRTRLRDRTGVLRRRHAGGERGAGGARAPGAPPMMRRPS